MPPPSSSCIEHLEGNRYRCRNTGQVIVTKTLPIRCCPEEGVPKLEGKRPSEQLLGDWLAAMIATLTLGKVVPCKGCLKRKEWLNKMHARLKGRLAR